MVAAQALHHMPMVRPFVVHPQPVVATMKQATRWSTSRDVMLALFLAIGLSSAFFSPLRPRSIAVTPTRTSTGRILGATTTEPLTINVVATRDQSEWRQTMTPAPRTLIEALSKIATAAGSTMEYRSLNTSMYLTKFLGLGDDTTGRWRVSINGVTVTDLSLPVLQQGDEIRIERLPS